MLQNCFSKKCSGNLSEFGIPGCYADCSNFIGSALYIVHIEIKQYLTL